MVSLCKMTTDDFLWGLGGMMPILVNIEYKRVFIRLVTNDTGQDLAALEEEVKPGETAYGVTYDDLFKHGPGMMETPENP